jgi:lipopolysaccharide/colanic/teichoic acid biosynthesis glycosyltransferase
MYAPGNFPNSIEGIDPSCRGGAGVSLSRTPYILLKTCIDLALAAILLLLTAPLILLIMAIVRLTSAGPALYTQVRLGRGGRRFVIYKIRTMLHDCERLTGARWSNAGDPRITPLGRLLRRSHLDELPQLWNVLRGEMSLVGPRPERPEIVVQLEVSIPQYWDRLAVQPGITGLAQVQLPPDEAVSEVYRKISCDLCYIERMGLWLDARILAGTALKVIGVSAEWRSRLLWLPGLTTPVGGECTEVVETEATPNLQAIY